MAVDSNLQTVEIKRFQCRHIFTDGHRCGSPSLRGENFCYFHHATQKVVSDPYHRAARRNGIDLPMPEDRAALILAIGEVLQGVATKAINTKEAGVMLYGLQVANSTLPREHSGDIGPARANSRTQPRRSTRERPAPGDLEKLAPVEDTVSDDCLGTIAPAAEYLEPEEKEERKSLASQLLDEVEEYEDRQNQLEQERAMRDQIETAVRVARAEAREEALAEAYINIKEVAESARATAIAETEARLRAELAPPTPTTLPTIQAVAPQVPPPFTSTRHPRIRHSRIRHRRILCHSRRESASVLPPSAGCPISGSFIARCGILIPPSLVIPEGNLRLPLLVIVSAAKNPRIQGRRPAFIPAWGNAPGSQHYRRRGLKARSIAEPSPFQIHTLTQTKIHPSANFKDTRRNKISGSGARKIESYGNSHNLAPTRALRN